jgi:hypothetical protein
VGEDDSATEEIEKVTKVAKTFIDGNEPKAHKDEEWSFSKRQVLFQCPRKYYYQYFGANSRTAKAEPLKKRLRELKALSNVHLRGGDILDLVIRTYLRRASQGERWDSSRLEGWAVSIFRKDRAFNKAGMQLAQGDPFPPVPLLEYDHHFTDADDRYVAAEAKLVTAIRNFSQASIYGHYREYGVQIGAMIQQRTQLKIDGATARGKLDLAFEGPDFFEIVDWKIGLDSGADQNLQVGFYGVWASSQPEIRKPLRLSMAYLGDGTLKHFNLEDVRPRPVRARITQDLNVMRSLQPFGVAATARAFTPCGQPKICILCPFQSVCPQKE